MDIIDRITNLLASYEDIQNQMSSFAHSRNIYFLNPYEKAGTINTKCNFHCHTTNSHDGSSTPTQLMDSYRKAGYDLISISDHSYLTNFNYSGVFCCMGAEPISDIGDYLLIDVEKSNRDTCQALISSRQTMQYKPLRDICDIVHTNPLFAGSIIAIAHPSWLGASQYINSDYDFFEISNGRNCEIVFNRVLASGKRCFIMADDDTHGVAYNNGPYTNILVNSKTKTNIIEALRKGQCYAVIGTYAPSLNITIEGKTIKVTSSITADIDFLCGDNGTEAGYVRYTVRGKYAEYLIPDKLPYIRVKAYNNKPTTPYMNYTLSQVFWRI